MQGIRYRAFVDPSGGRHDAACMAVAHKDQDGRVVVDVLRGAQAPHDPQIVAEDFAKLARTYGCAEVVGDRYSGEWVAQAFTKAGVRYSVSDLTKSEIYLECVAHFASGKVRLPTTTNSSASFASWSAVSEGLARTHATTHGMARTITRTQRAARLICAAACSKASCSSAPTIRPATTGAFTGVRPIRSARAFALSGSPSRKRLRRR